MNKIKLVTCFFIIALNLFAFISCGTIINDNQAKMKNFDSSNESFIISDSLESSLNAETIISEKHNKISNNSKSSTTKSVPKKNDKVVESQNSVETINNLFQPVVDNGGIFAIEVKSYDTDFSFSAGNTEKMISASLIKLFVAATVYDNMDNVKQQENYQGETDVLINKMISESDNDACNMLINRLGGNNAIVGMEKVNNYCKEHGFADTQINRLMLDFNGLENYTTVKDCTQLLNAFYNEALDGSKEILTYMKNQMIRTKIPVGINDDNTVVANKTGELATVENDVAIIYNPSCNYSICIMTNNIQDTALAREIISNASSTVHSYMVNSNQRQST